MTHAPGLLPARAATQPNASQRGRRATSTIATAMHDRISALLRRNLNTGRGAVRAGWAFPVVRNLKGDFQAFSGYGDNLIDYDSFQRKIGLGVLLDF